MLTLFPSLARKFDMTFERSELMSLILSFVLLKSSSSAANFEIS